MISSRFLMQSRSLLAVTRLQQRLISATVSMPTLPPGLVGASETQNQIHQKIAGRQRFYKVVGVKEAAEGKGFHVTLDGLYIFHLIFILSILTLYSVEYAYRENSENTRFVYYNTPP